MQRCEHPVWWLGRIVIGDWVWTYCHHCRRDMAWERWREDQPRQRRRRRASTYEAGEAQGS